MKKLALLTCAAVISAPSFAGAATIADQNHWRPVYTTLPARGINYRTLPQQQLAGLAIPTWSSSVKSPLDGNTYNFTIVGANPQTSNKTTTVSYVPIVLRVHLPGGVVLDPTQPGCNDTVSVQDRFFKGPNFVAVPLKSNGISVGPAQVVDGFQRSEFWSYVKKNKLWHTVLKAAAPVRVVDYTPSGGQAVGGVCTGSNHDIGEVDINTYDAEMRSLATTYAKPNQIPLVLSYNVFQTSGGCCILGYHSAFNTGNGTQVYSVGAYNDPGIFSVPIEDIHAWTHEIGEAFNDPYIGNATPAWGHTGQVSGCQNNFEVGDPLTGTPFALTYNGFAYHPQELVDFSWFYRTPALGTGGEYSFEGTFETAQGKCT